MRHLAFEILVYTEDVFLEYTVKFIVNPSYYFRAKNSCLYFHVISNTLPSYKKKAKV